MERNKHVNLNIVYGLPGAGKDSASAAVIAHLNEVGRKAVLLSTGDICREIQNPKSTYPFIEDYRQVIGTDIEMMKAGELVPTPKIITIVEHATDHYLAEGVTDIFMPGFPRTEKQALALHKSTEHLKEQGIDVNLVELLLLLSKEQALYRTTVIRRKEMEALGLEPRDDDLDISKAETRMEVFYKETMDAVIHAQLRGTLGIIDASLPKEVVQQQAFDYFISKNGFFQNGNH